MRDVWVVECEPCELSAGFDTQESAIAHAEEHNFATHRGLPDGQRGRGQLACIQQRTQVTPGVVPAAPPELATTEPASPVTE